MNVQTRNGSNEQDPAAHGVDDSCGCTTGARFMGIAFAISSAWNVHLLHSRSLVEIYTQVLLISLAAAVVGKIVGIASYRRGQRRPSPPLLHRALGNREFTLLTADSSPVTVHLGV